MRDQKLIQTQTNIAQLEQQQSSLEKDLADKSAQITELKALIQVMHEQKNKDIKQADKKNMAAIKKQVQQGTCDSTMMFILDNMMKFLAKDTGASFNANGEEFFRDEKVYGESVRKVKPEVLDKNELRKIAHNINLDEDGSQGRIQVQLLNIDDPTKYLNYFCHFKVLFKLVQIGLSNQRVNAL